MSGLVAAHQPNFLPWLGYFDKLARADVFVVLDDVQFPRTGRGTWTNRTQVLVNGKGHWLTVPVRRDFNGSRAISAMEIDESQGWRDKRIKTIRMAYGRAPGFEEVWETLEPLLMNSVSNLAEYNLSLIYGIGSRLGIDTSKIVLGSELRPVGHSTDMLIEIVKKVGGDEYLAGGGAAGYQEDAKFAGSNVRVQYQRFVQLPYRQHGSAAFVPGLSILDVLMNRGISGTRSSLEELSS
jgi:hypothetical protein